jgi:protein Lines
MAIKLLKPLLLCCSFQIAFLGFCSDYVKHSAGNILVSMSISLVEFVCFSYLLLSLWVHSFYFCQINFVLPVACS